MGQPKFPRKKYETPNHPWQGDRIKAEHELKRKFGLKNKREIWKAQTRLREIRGQARTLVSRTRNPDDSQANREANLLLKRLHRQGYTGEGATLDEVLALDVERILNRRLQSQVYLKGMARTMNQARQFVNHGAIRIGDRRVTVPSYVVRREEEDAIAFDPNTPVASEDHPVRPKPEGFEIQQELANRSEAAALAVEAGNATVTEAPAEAASPAEAAPEAAAEVKAEPTAEAEVKAEPTVEPEAAPAPEVTPEPAPEPAEASAPDPTPEPVEAPAPEPAPEAAEATVPQPVEAVKVETDAEEETPGGEEE